MHNCFVFMQNKANHTGSTIFINTLPLVVVAYNYYSLPKDSFLALFQYDYANWLLFQSFLLCFFSSKRWEQKSHPQCPILVLKAKQSLFQDCDDDDDSNSRTHNSNIYCE